MINRLELQGILAERGELRFTPAGIEALDFVLQHQSTQTEADMPCETQLQIACVGFGKIAREMHRLSPGVQLHVSGFLRASRRGSRQMKLHVTQYIEV
ncbi:primosomal replication protein N [Thiomonas intermedia]|uniref:primosomal replication protein N n=1 Tax=Thiomonas intermedia TaxID=926 RepID=UPI00318421AC